jgi:hypothetical protein
MRGISIFQIHMKFSIVVLPQLYIFPDRPPARQTEIRITESSSPYVPSGIALPFREPADVFLLFKLLRVLPILAVLIVFFACRDRLTLHWLH